MLFQECEQKSSELRLMANNLSLGEMFSNVEPTQLHLVVRTGELGMCAAFPAFLLIALLM